MSISKKPKEGDYPKYFTGYISLIPEGDYSSQILTQIVETQQLFREKGEQWSEQPYESGKWTPKEVLGHVIDTERIMTFRALCFARGEKSALPGFDQDPYVLNARFGEIEVEDLLADFEAQRKALLTLLKILPENSLDFQGNANGSSVTPRALFWMISGHFIHHLNILKDRY